MLTVQFGETKHASQINLTSLTNKNIHIVNTSGKFGEFTLMWYS